MEYYKNVERYQEDFLIEGRKLLSYTGSSKNVVVPDIIECIGESSFAQNETVENIVLPDSVTEIEKGAFSGCPNLERLSIPAECRVESWFFNELRNTFSGCFKLADEQGLIILNNKVYACIKSTEEIVIPDGVTAIENDAFYYRKTLKRITLPDTVTEIGAHAFCGCTALKEVRLSSNLEMIYCAAFCGCSELTSITIPKSVKCISSDVFLDCTGLKKVVFENDDVRMEEGVFGNCPGLVDEQGCFVLNGVLYCYYGQEEKATIPTHVKKIDAKAFRQGRYLSGVSDGCKKIREIVIPESVEEIDAEAFSRISNIIKVDIQGPIQCLEFGVFNDCENLEEIRLPESLTEIKNCAFGCCKSLKTIVIPENVKKIYTAAFGKCEVLSRAIFCGNTDIEDYAFDGCKKMSITLLGDDMTIRKASFRQVDIFEIIAPNISIDHFASSLKKAAVKGFVQLKDEGAEISKTVEKTYQKYIKAQRGNLLELAVENEALLRYMISEEILSLENVDKLINNQRLSVEMKAVVMEYQNKTFSERKRENKLNKDFVL